MANDLFDSLRAPNLSKQAVVDLTRRGDQGPKLEKTTQRALATLARDGSEAMEAHLTLPFGDPTDPLHAAKWEHITSLRLGTAIQDEVLGTRVFTPASVTPSKLDRSYLESDGGFVTGNLEVQAQSKGYSMACGFGTTFFRVIQRETTEGWLWA